MTCFQEFQNYESPNPWFFLTKFSFPSLQSQTWKRSSQTSRLRWLDQKKSPNLFPFKEGFLFKFINGPKNTRSSYCILYAVRATSILKWPLIKFLFLVPHFEKEVVKLPDIYCLKLAYTLGGWVSIGPNTCLRNIWMVPNKFSFSYSPKLGERSSQTSWQRWLDSFQWFYETCCNFGSLQNWSRRKGFRRSWFRSRKKESEECFQEKNPSQNQIGPERNGPNRVSISKTWCWQGFVK